MLKKKPLTKATKPAVTTKPVFGSYSDNAVNLMLHRVEGGRWPVKDILEEFAENIGANKKELVKHIKALPKSLHKK